MKRALPLLALVVALLVAGCGGGAKKSAATSAAQATTAAATTAAATTAAQGTTPDVQEGGTVPNEVKQTGGGAYTQGLNICSIAPLTELARENNVKPVPTAVARAVSAIESDPKNRELVYQGCLKAIAQFLAAQGKK
jgi:hypothetical protein